MRKVITAKTAGFCFGVSRAVRTCYEQAERGKKPIYTFGPIIHNEQVVEDLRRHGVEVIADEQHLSRIKEGTVIIRSHGVSRRIYEKIAAQGLEIVDATCPFVKKIHRIVNEKSALGHEIVIIGNASHPEVEGICGWSERPVHVIETAEQARAFRRDPERPLTIVCQTTFNSEKFNKLVEIIDGVRYDRDDVLNTICNATEERQTEAARLASEADAMIVIGGRSSSNTQKLYDICKQKCNQTYYIQTLADLDFERLPSVGCVGITAGASTPRKLIEEVSKHAGKKF